MTIMRIRFKLVEQPDQAEHATCLPVVSETQQLAVDFANSLSAHEVSITDLQMPFGVPHPSAQG